MDQGKGKPEASLDRESPEPLYQQIAARIEEGVRAGWLRAGDQIESEPALASTYGVSRVTIRQAIGALARKGLVIRKQGKGTFVAGPAGAPMTMQQPHGLFWSLFEQSDKASVRLLRYELQTPPEAVRAMMSLDAGEQALALERLYLIDGTPVAFCEDWLHPRAATVSRARANFISTEDILHEVGFRVTQTETVIRAEMPNERIKGILELGRDSAVMAMHRSAFVEDGTAKEIARSWFCSDGYELCFSSRDQGARTGPLSVRSIEKTRRP